MRRIEERLKLIHEAMSRAAAYFDNKSDSVDIEDENIPNVEARLEQTMSDAIATLEMIYVPMSVAELMQTVVEKQIIIDDQAKYRDPIALTCRFIAYVEVTEVLDAFNTRDWIDLIIEGTPAAGPFKTEEHIQKWIDGIEADWIEGIKETDEESPWTWLDKSLEEFFR